jgi:N-methylhydantoinase B
MPGTERFETRESSGPLSIDPSLQLWETDATAAVDPITYEVVAHKLEQMLDEYSSVIVRVSGSMVVSEAFDYNVGLASGRGDLVTCGRGAGLHAAPLQDAIRWTLQHRSANPGIEEGDLFLTNDPWTGGTHQPDTSLLAPIFVDGRLFCWAGSCMHMLDAGGSNPGIAPGASSVFEEAVPTPPVKLARRGVVQRDIEDLFIRRSRLPLQLTLDLRAMAAAARVASERIKEIVERYCADVVHRVIEQMISGTEAELRRRMLSIPDGEWRHEMLHEVSGPGDRGVYPIEGALRKQGDALTFDFRNASPEKGFLNTTRSNTKAGVMCAVLPLLCPDLTWSVGAVMRVVDFEFTDGTVQAAQFPAAVSGGPVTGGMAAVTIATVLISKMLSAGPEELRRNLSAVSNGALPYQMLDGPGRDGDYSASLSLDMVSGGSGARAWRDGDGVAGWSGATASLLANIETIEEDAPLLYLYRRELRDSGGAGTFQGGAGGESAVILHETAGPLGAQCATYGQAVPSSAGINGGFPAKAVGYLEVVDSDIRPLLAAGRWPRDTEEIGGAVRFPHPKELRHPLTVDDVFLLRWSGGGGYGDPLERDPATVARDIHEGAVSVERAHDVYGVILRDAALDEAATVARREALRGARIGVAHAPVPEPAVIPEGARRLDDHLVVLADEAVACAHCATRLTDGVGSYKEGAAVLDRELLDVHLVWIDSRTFIDEDIVLREFSCPGCAALLASDVTRRSSAPLADKTLLPIAAG